MIKAVFKSANELDRKCSVSYTVEENNGDYYITAAVECGNSSEKAFLGRCSQEKAEELALLFASKGVHPLHIEDIISDLCF